MLYSFYYLSFNLRRLKGIIHLYYRLCYYSYLFINYTINVQPHNVNFIFNFNATHFVLLQHNNY
jgi:hypothetical protein